MYILFHHPIEKLELQTSWGGGSIIFLIPEEGGRTIILTVLEFIIITESTI